MTIVALPSDSSTRTPWPGGRASILGVEVDHLRLYGWTNADIARRLNCSVDAVAKWIKAHPEPRESWEVSA